MLFELFFRSGGWVVSNGFVEFGPYPTRETAAAWAVSLSRRTAQSFGLGYPPASPAPIGDTDV